MLNWNAIGNGLFVDSTNPGYYELGYQIISTFEGSEALPYLDGVNDPTIGYGYNLTDANILRQVLSAFGIGSGYGFDATILSIVNGAQSTNSNLRNDLNDAILAFSQANPGIVNGSNVRTTFTMSQQEAHTLFPLILPTYDLRVRNGLTDNPTASLESAVLASLSYNGVPITTGSRTNAAVTAGDRAEVWFEIRYGSNAITPHGSTTKIDALELADAITWSVDDDLRGLANRRYAESHMFGLYDDLNTTTAKAAGGLWRPGELEALKAFRTLHKHNERITAYENIYGAAPAVGNPQYNAHSNVALIGTGASAQLVAAGLNLGTYETLQQALEHGRRKLVESYAYLGGVLPAAPGRTQATGLIGLAATLTAFGYTGHLSRLTNDDAEFGVKTDIGIDGALAGELADAAIQNVIVATNLVGPTLLAPAEVAQNLVDRSAEGGNNLIFGSIGTTGLSDASVDTLIGGDDSDFFVGGGGGDTINGGDGEDTVSYMASTAGVVVRLGGANSGGFADADTLIDIENVIGSNIDTEIDEIHGSEESNVLFGLKGVDRLYGAGGNDFLFGGDGNDELHGGDGYNVLFGGAGDDIAYYDDTMLSSISQAHFYLMRATNEPQPWIFLHGTLPLLNVDKLSEIEGVRLQRTSTASPLSFKYSDDGQLGAGGWLEEVPLLITAEGEPIMLDLGDMEQGVNIGASSVDSAVSLFQQFLPSTRETDFRFNAIRTRSVTEGRGLTGASGEKFSGFTGLKGTEYDDNVGVWKLSPAGELTPEQLETLSDAKKIGGPAGTPAEVGAIFDARMEAAAVIPQNQIDVEIDVGDGDDRVIGTMMGHNIIRGGDGEDKLTAGGFTSEVYGGAGSDRVSGAGFKSHLYGGDGSGPDTDSDLFSLANHAFVMDAGTNDHVTWGDGFVLTGGVKQWWMEGDWYYWSPYGSLISALPMASLNIASMMLYTLDAITMTTFRYGLSESNQLIVQFGRGRGGQAIVENYHADLDTGKSTGNILIFGQQVLDSREKGLSDLRNYVALALKAGWGLEFSGSDPLVLDLDGDGVELLRRESSRVFFDVDNDGFAEDTGWVSADDGILARDLNSNGTIDNASELFGDATTSGFAALGSLDSNADGKITSADTNFATLKVWRDLDSDGVTDAGELQTLTEAGITELALANNAPTQPDILGNTVRAEGMFKRGDGSTSVMADVVLNVYQTDSVFLGAESTSSAADALPDLKGYGDMQRLRVAMSADATLLALVDGLPAAGSISSWEQMQDATAEILFRWAAVDGMTPAAIEAGLDTQQLAFLEKYLGYELAPRDGLGSPTASTAAEMAAAWKDVLANATIRLFAQGPLASVFQNIAYSAATDRFHADSPSDLADVLAAVVDELPSVGAADVLADLWGPATEAFIDAFVRADRHDVRGDYAMQALVAATETVTSPLGLADLAEGLGLTGVQTGDASANTLARSGAAGLLTYVGGEGNDTLNGGTGQDVYVFGTGFGQDTINDAEMTDSGDRLRFATLNADDVTLTRVGLDLVVSVNGASDTVTVKNQFITPTISPMGIPITPDHGVEEIQFADGRILEAIDIAAAIGLGTSASETLEGTGTSDEIEGLAGDDLLKGGDSGDTYYYTAGDGNDVIDDVMTNPLLSTADTLVLLGGIGLEDLQFERIGASDDLKLIVDGEGAAITIKNQFDYTPLGYDSKYALNQRIEAVFLSDGTAITWYELQSLVIQTYTSAGSETTYGFGTADEFYASAGDDVLVGFDGGDTYWFGHGSGVDQIDDQSQYVDTFVAGLVGHAWTTDDTLKFGRGIELADLVFTRSAENTDLVIGLAGTTDQITITEQFDGRKLDLFGLVGVKWFNKVERFEFADGSSMTWEDVIAIVTTGGEGDDTLIGDFYADTLDGGAGNDFLNGGDMGDTYRFGVGDGQDVIEDAPGYLIETLGDKLVFKEGVAVADVVWTREGADLIASITGTADQVRIRNQYQVAETGPFGAQAFHRIDEFRWFDGTIVTWQDLHQQVIDASATSGADTILGTHFDDVLDGGAGDDQLSGGNGSDTYNFDFASGGHDTIEDNGDNLLADGEDTLWLGEGSDHDDFNLSRSGPAGEHVTLTHAVSGASVTILNQFAYNSLAFRPDLIEFISFDDGTMWDTPALMAAFLDQASTSGNDDVVGFYTSDVIEGLAGDDTLRGGDGADTYRFDAGFGQDLIRESVGNVMYSDLDVIEFGAGLDIGDIRFAAEGGDLVISFDGMTDTITVEGQFVSEAYFGSWTDIELIRFDGGAELTAQQIRDTILANAATSGADTITGFFTADTLAGGSGADTLRGGSGGDTYTFNTGDGADLIEESMTDHAFLDGPDTVRFGAGIARTDVTFTRSGDDLLATIAGGSDSVRVKDHFLGGYKTVEFFAFADGSVVTRQTAEAGSVTAQATSGADIVIGTAGADVLNGALGNDQLEGGDGDDVYQFDLGSGQDVILDDNGSDHSTGDVLAFGAGITPDMVTVTRAANTLDLTLSLAGGAGEVTILNQFKKYNLFSSSEWNLIERVTFADGSAWTADDLRTRIVADAITAGNDVITGFWTAETFNGGAGNDTIDGRGGIDRFVLDRDGGNDVVHADGDDILWLGGGLTLDEISIGRDGDDMIATVVDTGATLRIVDHFFANALGSRLYSLASLEVGDGTVLTRTEIDDRAFDASFTSGNDVHVGLQTDDVFAGSAGNDTMYGNGGADVFVFGRGSGNDIVDDTIDNGPTPVDAIQFADGITASDIVFEAQNSSHERSTSPVQLLIRIKDTTDSLLIRGHYQYDPLGNSKRVEEFRFADGTVLTYQDVDELITTGAGTDAGDDIFGLWGPDVLDGGHGADTLTGGPGGDIYVFDRGHGADTIAENAGSTAGAADPDTIRFGGGVAEQDVVFERQGADLVVRILGTADVLTVKDQFSYAGSALDRSYRWVERFEFASGTTLTIDQVRQRIVAAAATASADTLTGYYGSQTLDGSLGADTLRGLEDADTYVVGRNAGADIIDDQGLSMGDVLKFKAGIVPGDVSFSRLGNDLLISIAGSADTVKVHNNFYTTSGGNAPNRIEHFVFEDGSVLTHAQIEAATNVAVFEGTSGNDTLTGNDVTTVLDVLIGYEGDDVLNGRKGEDHIHGGAGNDVLIGGDGADLLNGDEGDDDLYGDNGDDILNGGAGNDMIRVDPGLDVIDGGEGVDVLDAQYVYVATTVDLAAGTYTISGVTETVVNVENVIGGSAADSITGDANDNHLDGRGGADTIVGGAGNDRLDGGADIDVLTGGLGDDTYVFSSASDVAIENSDEGIDTIEVPYSYSLASLPNIENLTLTGHVHNATGNAGNNVLRGTWASNRIDGGAGDDTMYGYGNADTFVVDSSGDVVIEYAGDTGTDIIEAWASYSLATAPNVERLNLMGSADLDATGGDGNDQLNGNSGHNRIDGGAGADTMSGGAGNDTFVVDHASDVVSEGVAAGIDLVEASVTYSLGIDGDLENLTLAGTADINGTGNGLGNVLTGNAGANVLDGGTGADTLYGNDGDDRLVGGTGADQMHGGRGDDTYVVDNVSDVVNENTTEGNDTIESTLTYSLASLSNVENLNLLGTGNLNATGNAAANVLTGNSGNNRLDGGAGDDTMIGGGGNDTFVVDSAGDVVVEEYNGGTDTVEASISYALGENVNNVTLTGTANLDATGNEAGNILTGNSGANRLDGGAGADTMVGGAGNDTYIVDNTSDVVTEGSGAGTDAIEASVSFNISNNVESILLTGSSNINSTGNALSNTMTGNSGANSLSGGDGDDTIHGMDGNDSLFAWNGADTLVGGAGNDTMYGDMGADVYRFGVDFGQDTIEDNGQNGTTEIDRILFTDYNTTDLTFGLANAGLDLTITVTGTSHTVTVKNHFATAKHDWLDEIEFANGTIWNRAAIASAVGLPPVVLDLDGDGIELVSRTASTVSFDTDNDGKRQRTGWVGADDGILALDRNGDGRITMGNEMSFISDRQGATSDLEGLAAFDSNRNGLLDAGDDEFGRFRVWRDANQDGVSQNGELRTLAAWGIASIGLAPSESFERPPGAQDNAVLGLTTYTRTDGSTGVAADVALSYDGGAGAANQPARRAGLFAGTGGEPAVERLRFHQARGLFAGNMWDVASISPEDDVIPGERAQRWMAAGSSATASVDKADGMYGQPELLDDVPAHVAGSAPAGVEDIDPADKRLTMYGDLEPADLKKQEDPRVLLDAISEARMSWVSLHSWSLDLVTAISPYDHPLSHEVDLPHAAGPQREAASSHDVDRHVLQMIDAMAAFNPRSAGGMVSGIANESLLQPPLLATDVRAA